MFDFINRLFSPIDPETVVALRSKMPDSIAVFIHKDPSGQYVANISYDDTKRPIVTQASTGQELIEMVNDAVYTMIDIPANYRPYFGGFTPPEEVRKALKANIPQKYLDKKLSLAKA